MKKMIIAACIVAFAAVSQAASVTWAATSVKDINNNAAKSIAEAAGWTAVCTIYASDGTTVIGSNTAKTSNAMSKFSGTVDGTANNTSYYAQLVITDGSGNKITSDKALFTTDSAASYGDINFTTGANFAEATAKIDYASGWKSSAAPEPTSGMLLLLGMAGLALRRKQK